MSKPIFIVRFPAEIVMENRDRFEEVSRDLQAKLSDYHVLVVMESALEATQFECFNAINATDKDIQELRDMCLNAIKDLRLDS
jgi:hypothetical protein